MLDVLDKLETLAECPPYSDAEVVVRASLRMQAGPKFTNLLQEALKLVSDCDCSEVTGCPGCVQFMHCDAYNIVLNKQGAIIVLAITLENELAARSGDLDAASYEQPDHTAAMYQSLHG
jgi:ATP-dependent helicase YprA (DUF1998 family)